MGWLLTCALKQDLDSSNVACIPLSEVCNDCSETHPTLVPGSLIKRTRIRTSMSESGIFDSRAFAAVANGSGGYGYRCGTVVEEKRNNDQDES